MGPLPLRVNALFFARLERRKQFCTGSIHRIQRLRFRDPVAASSAASAAMHVQQQPFTPVKRPSKAAVKCETWGEEREGEGRGPKSTIYRIAANRRRP